MFIGTGIGIPLTNNAASHITGGSSFYSDFTSGNQSLDPRITFSRASNATVTRADGTIGFAPHNLSTFSEQADNILWTKSAASITANTTVAPDGTTTADKLVEDSTTAGHWVSPPQGVTFQIGQSLTYSVYVKAAERTFVQLIFTAIGSGGTNYIAGFDLTNGTAGTPTAGATSAITSVGNSWYRCSISAPVLAVGAPLLQTRIAQNTNASAASYAGNGTSGLFIWGAQLNVGSLQPYYPTTVKNLLGFSEAFDNAAWTKSNSTVSANTTVTAAPNGTFTADKLVSTASTSIQQVTEFSFSTINATPYTFSTYVKAAEYTFARIRSFEGSPFARAVFIDVNLTTGAIVRTDATGGAVLTSSSVTDVGNGWYRASMTFTLGGTGTAIAGQIVLNDGTNNFNITGNGTSGIYVWGAQLSDSASLDTYVNNPVAAPTAAAYYGPRFDYDPVTLQPRGLLIEEQRTNLLLNSKIDGTNLATQIVTSAATTYTLSFYGTGTVVLSGTATATVVGTGAYPTRTTYSFTALVGALTLTVSGTVQFAQLEAGAFATSYIPTTASQVTRSADVALIQGSNFSGWYNQSEGTIYGNYSTSMTSSRPVITPRSTATADNRVQFGTASAVVVVGGSVQANIGSGTNITSGKQAFAYKLNDFAGIIQGTPVSTIVNTDTSGTVPTVDYATIGYFDFGGGERLNGHIRQLAYYPRRLSNTELQAVTA